MMTEPLRYIAAASKRKRGLITYSVIDRETGQTVQTYLFLMDAKADACRLNIRAMREWREDPSPIGYVTRTADGRWVARMYGEDS